MIESQKKLLYSFLLLAVCWVPVHKSAYSLTFERASFERLNRIPLDRAKTGLKNKIRFKDIRSQRSGLSRGLYLATPKDLPFKSYIRNFLDPYMISDDIELRVSRDFVKQKTSRQTVFYKFFIGDLQIEEYLIKANKQKNGSIFITGNVPDIKTEQNDFYNSDFPATRKIVENVVRPYLIKSEYLMGHEKIEMIENKKCATIRDLSLYKALCITVGFSNSTYRLMIDQFGVSKITKNSFNLKAVLKNVYIENSEGESGDHNVEIADSPGNVLGNSRFYVEPKDGPKIEPDAEAQFSFDNEDSSAARQIHAFSFANRMFDWYESLGLDLVDEGIVIETGAKVAGSDDNAAFFPSQKKILIGKGSGEQFINLGLDIDVVAHEVGHFVISKGINDVADDESKNIHSGAIHEGLADFFTYASTGDACLADSICVEGTPACYISSCLRVGEDIGFSYDSPLYPTNEGVHIRGQLLAAVLWETRKDLQASEYFSFDQVVVNALDYVASSNISFGDFIEAVMASDKELQDGKFCEGLYDVAVDYGLTDLIDSSCSEISPDASRDIVDVTNANESEYDKGTNSVESLEESGGNAYLTISVGSKSDQRRFVETGSCSSIGNVQRTSDNFYLSIILLILFPSIVSLRGFMLPKRSKL